MSLQALLPLALRVLHPGLHSFFLVQVFLQEPPSCGQRWGWLEFSGGRGSPGHSAAQPCPLSAGPGLFEANVSSITQIIPGFRIAVYKAVASMGQEKDFYTTVRLHKEAELHGEGTLK